MVSEIYVIIVIGLVWCDIFNYNHKLRLVNNLRLLEV